MEKFNITTNRPVPRSEQESILIFDVEKQVWLIYTNYPKHARRWAERVKPEKNGINRKTYHADNNDLIELQGEIEGFVSVSAPRKISDNQRKEIGKRLKKSNKIK